MIIAPILLMLLGATVWTLLVADAMLSGWSQAGVFLAINFFALSVVGMVWLVNLKRRKP